MPNFNISKDVQSGRSMIEMLGVLAIIGVLGVGGIAGYSKAMLQYKINKTADQITQIVGNVRTLFSSQKNYRKLVYIHFVLSTFLFRILKKRVAHLLHFSLFS